MPTVLHIDGFNAEPRNFAIRAGTTFLQAIKDLGGNIVGVEYVPDARPRIRQIPADVERFIRTYEREDAGSVLAVCRRYDWLDAEEFDMPEEAKRFLENGEDWGMLAGEAVVDGDQIEVWD